MTTPAPPAKPRTYTHTRPTTRREPTEAASQWCALARANPGAWFQIDIPADYTEEQVRLVRLDLEATRWLCEDTPRLAVSARTVTLEDGARYIRYRVYFKPTQRRTVTTPRKAATVATAQA